MRDSCEHRRIKKNFPFGRNSTPTMFCKDCGEVITRHERMLEKRNNDQRRGGRRR